MANVKISFCTRIKSCLSTLTILQNVKKAVTDQLKTANVNFKVPSTVDHSLILLALTYCLSKVQMEHVLVIEEKQIQFKVGWNCWMKA